MKSKAIALLLASASINRYAYVYAAGITTEVGAPLGTIADCEMSVGEDDGVPTCILRFGVYEHFGPTSSFTTRNYLMAIPTPAVADDGQLSLLPESQPVLNSLPGPTIRIRAGDTFRVHLVNELDQANNQPMGADINLPHLPNTTNFHTHGLHVSGLSPGDDVFASVEPGESLMYTFEVPENHMGGTFFYHPHHHGSVSLQLGGGACGMIIVEDEIGSLPPQIAGMEDVALLLMYIEPNRVRQIQNLFDTHLLNTQGGGPPAFLTNGQTSPVKQVETGVWTRFRILYTSMSHLLILSQELDPLSGASCELQLIAKDGIYLNHAPRLITDIYLPEAGRADVAIRCTGEGNVNFLAAVQNRQTYIAFTLSVFTPQPAVEPTPLPSVQRSTDTPSTSPTFSTDTPSISPTSLINTPSTSPTSPVDIAALIREPILAPFAVHRPCYLVDTRLSTPTTFESLTLGTGNPNTKLNGIFYSSKDESLNPTNPFYTGTLGEVSIVQGLFVHVLHIHVNPFQLAFISPVIDDIYFQEGDWHDTLNVFIGRQQGDAEMRLRMWLDKFAGHAVVHCHMLNDEDAGMMNTYQVLGEEGQSVDSVAREIDPLCYSDLSSRGYVLE